MAAAIESLPSELVCNITERLLGACAFGSVAALARGSRRLYLRVAPLLYDNVGRVNRHAGQDGLIWAAEHDEVRVLRSLLECGVDPNACFWSGLPHSVCQEVFTAQRLRRRLSPRVDGHLVAKLVREYLVWNQEHVPGLTPSGERELLRAWYLATINGDIPEYLPTWELDVVHGGTICVAEMVDAARFSCRPGSHSEPADSLYSWTALHVATQRGNGQAVEALLLQGADIELKCQGLCDCLTPTGSRFGTQERPPIWTALHIAICSGHEHVARILLSRGANYLTVGQMTTHDPRLVAPEDGITAFHSAALRGNVAMCQLLLDHHVASSSETGNDVLELEDSRGLRALDYAVAAGHTRTAGSWLLEHGADPLQAIALNEREFLAPLNFLCFRGQYRDAQYLLDRIQCRPADYTLALQSCFMWLLTRDQSFARTVGYLRHFLDGHMEYMEDVVSDNPPLLEHDSEDALICLVKRLLEVGANPSAMADLRCHHVWSSSMDLMGRSALHLAASRGQRAAVKILLDAGVPLELRPAGRSSNLLRPTPLGSAMMPLLGCLGRGEPLAHLETIILLLELGASFKNAIIGGDNPSASTNPKSWFAPFFRSGCAGLLWYNSGHFDLVERLLELVARQLGHEEVPVALVADLLYAIIKDGGSDGNLCRWLVQRYKVAPTDFSASDLEHFSPIKAAQLRFGFRPEPGLLEWMLDFMPSIATEIAVDQHRTHLGLSLADRGLFRCAKILVERGLADKAPVDDTDGETCRAWLKERYRNLIFAACCDHTEEGAADFVGAVLDRALSASLGDLSGLLVHERGLATSWAVCNELPAYTGQNHLPGAKSVLKAVLTLPSPLYGVKGRCRGERPSIEGSWDSFEAHPFYYPVPIAVSLGRAELLELMLKDTPPPSPDNIMEVLAMALDVGSQEPEPAVIRTLVENTAVDVSTLITRPVKAARIGNRIKGHVPPLYYLLKTFYKAHIIPKSTPGHAADTSAPASSWHDCDCPFKTRDGYLASSVGILVQHGASWLQPSQPSGETPLDVLAAILDGQDFDADVGPWPCHNRETLRSHVKLDWRASGVAGRLLGGRFNPIEVDGLEARWA